jgi:hypothetical protein
MEERTYLNRVPFLHNGIRQLKYGVSTRADADPLDYNGGRFTFAGGPFIGLTSQPGDEKRRNMELRPT